MPVKLIQQVVLPVEHHWVQRPPPADNGTPYPARRVGSVVVVHPHAIDAQLGQVCGHLLGVLVTREIGAEAQVDTPDSQAAGPGEEVAVLNAHKAIGSGSLGRKPREVRGRPGGIVAGHDKGKPLGG